VRPNVNLIGIQPQNSSDWLFFTGENLPKGGFKNFEDEFFSRFSISKSENSQSSPNFYIWFSVCSLNYEIMIKDL